MNVNDYIDFDKLFRAAIAEQEEHMTEYVKEDPVKSFVYKKILDFYNYGAYAMAVDLEESFLNDEVIVFAFSEEYQTANESNNQNGWLLVKIGYDIEKEKFETFETEAE